jgi:hypothetical protein
MKQRDTVYFIIVLKMIVFVNPNDKVFPFTSSGYTSL